MERNGHKNIDSAEPIHTTGNMNVPISLMTDDLEAASRLTIRNGDGSAQSLTVYGKVASQSTMPAAGTYTDTVTVTVSY